MCPNPSKSQRSLGVAFAFALVLLFTPLAQAQHSDYIDSITDYQVTQECLRCHTGHANDFMETIHWTWEHDGGPDGQVMGKNNVINNYCIAVGSNEPRCTSCHAGLGYADNTFDFTDKTKIDCLICHDSTGTYKKFPTGAGHPVYDEPKEFPPGSGKIWEPVDLLYVAQNVERPSRANCGACHFYGGGGDGVKHGDLDSTMANPSRDLDVHMGGMNFSCVRCHVPDSDAPHEIVGTRYSSDTTDNMLCESCHGDAPHGSSRLNTHTARVSCQACHIPAFARGGKATKTWWDWSTAGQKNPDGSEIVIKDENGDPIYDTKKGSFVWEENVIPEYTWFNGQVTYATAEDAVDPNGVVTINQLHGNKDEANARIFPVKRFRGLQPYDAGNQSLAVPHLFGKDADAYWKSYDWNLALAAGEAYLGREYSGVLGYVETEMFWIQNHMVAPKEQAVQCMECHTPRGRLDFEALGYSPEDTALLQRMGGFEIGEIGVKPDPTGVTLKWMGTPGDQYQVQVATAANASWVDADDGVRATPGDTPSELSWTDNSGATAGERYYQIIRSSQ